MNDHPSHPSRAGQPPVTRTRGLRISGRGTIALGAALLLAFGTTSCDFEVTNPGPVQADNLNDPGAFPSIIGGIQRAMIDAVNYTALHGASVTRELFPTGQTGQFGIEPLNSVGILRDDQQGTPWSASQQARWLAENAMTRMDEVLGGDADSSTPAAQAALWAGYANRHLGENMCETVIDGGAALPAEESLNRAKEQFTEAIAIGQAAGETDIVQAAYAGRAAVEVHLGEWSAAAADAAQVPTSFVFQLDFYNIGDDYQQNRIAWASMNQPYKAHSQWNTWYADYYDETGDPRVAYTFTDDVGTGALECCGVIAWWPQAKYDRASSIDLSTGTEMRLVEAEAVLRGGDVGAAVGLINEVRALAGVESVSATSAEEAWTLLKRERGIDLWLEGRRLGDLRRWSEADTPGALDPKEVVGDASYLQEQDLCFPISKTERDRNPNIG